MSTPRKKATKGNSSPKSAPKKDNSKGGSASKIALSNEELAKRRESRREELDKLSDEELRERFKNANGTEAAEHIDREAIMTAILDLGMDRYAESLDDEDEDEDEDNEIPESIRRHEGWQKDVVVRQTPTIWAGGELVRLEKQARVVNYSKDDFDRMVDEKFFQESGLEVEILNAGGE